MLSTATKIEEIEKDDWEFISEAVKRGDETEKEGMNKTLQIQVNHDCDPINIVIMRRDKPQSPF